MSDDYEEPREVWSAIRPVYREDTRTRSERRLARALLLSVTMHLLRQERQQCIDFGRYDVVKRWDDKIQKRLFKIENVIEEHYHL